MQTRENTHAMLEYITGGPYIKRSMRLCNVASPQMFHFLERISNAYCRDTIATLECIRLELEVAINSPKFTLLSQI